MYKQININTEDAVCYNDEVWFCALKFNGLFCINTLSGNTKVKVFPNEQYNGKRLFSSMKLVGNKIYCIPFFADSIVVYDINEDKFEYLVIDEIKAGYKKDTPHFLGVEKYKNYLFIFPVLCNCIIRLDLNTHEMIYISDWVLETDKYVFDHSDAYFRRQVVIRNSSLYIPFCNANAILELNGDTLKSKIYKMGTEDKGYSGICDDGERLWLSPRKQGSVVSWKVENNEIISIELEKENKNDSNSSQVFIGISFFNNKIYMFLNKSFKGKTYFKDDKVEILQGDFNFIKEDNKKVFYQDSNAGLLTIYNKINNSKRKMKLLIDAEDIDNEKIFEDNLFISESSEINIYSLLLYMKS